MAISLRPMSFQESRTTLDGLSAGLMASFFSCAWDGIVNVVIARTAVAIRSEDLRMVVSSFLISDWAT